MSAKKETSKRGRPKGKKKRKNFRPEKPYKDFPLCAHSCGKWMKSINGRIYYFGNWGRIRNGKMERLPDDGWKEAFELYKAQAVDLHAGRTPRSSKEGDESVANMCVAFMNHKLRLLESGEIIPTTFCEYKTTCERLIAIVGGNRLVDDLSRDDFEHLRAELHSRHYSTNPAGLGGAVSKIKSVFKYARKSDVVPPEFKKPSKAVMRKHRAEQAKKFFEAQELHWILDGKTDGDGEKIEGCSIQLRAMTLLGINCGFGNKDCADLQLKDIDLDRGVITFPRPKTGVTRRCILWQETVDALKKAIEERPRTVIRENQGCVFLTKYGNRWVRDEVKYRKASNGKKLIDKARDINEVSNQFRKVLRRLGINGRKGLGFYSLRHTFRTIADGSKDFPAARYIMGHVDDSMDGVYREHFDDDRLAAVAEHVYFWFIGREVKK